MKCLLVLIVLFFFILAFFFVGCVRFVCIEFVLSSLFFRGWGGRSSRSIPGVRIL